MQCWIREIGRPLDLAVNVCAAQIDSALDQKVEHALADSGLPREHLVLEMTEQTLIDRGAETSALPRETEDVVIVQTLVDMARRLSRQCIAEGVETEEQYQALRSIDPPLAQGWPFGRAVPAEEFLQLL